jgi:DNA-binding transcriptional LysR family regulator
MEALWDGALAASRIYAGFERMEMHQVRYFLAVARVLNFTRAAEECNVAQPSLTRAIKQLEEEFGGELFRRERNLTHLSDLGQRMLPLMQQCYDSAQSAKQMATSIKKGVVAPLSIGLSSAVSISLLVPILTELVRVFPGLEIRFSRGASVEIAERLKKGDVEVAVSGPFADNWDRLESWPLFTEPYKLAVSKANPLSKQSSVALEKIGKQRLLCRLHCENSDALGAFVRARGIAPDLGHKVETDSDLDALLAANLGLAIAPVSSISSPDVALIEIDGLNINRPVSIYSVAGRQRSTAASTMIKMMRAADWSDYGGVCEMPQKVRA